MKSFASERKEMVERQLKKRGIKDPQVLQAMEKAQRHLFVDESCKKLAYEDEPLPIGYGQTISQPYIVAFMAEAAQIKHTDRVLEIGTGSGYETAVLSFLAKEVYTVEIRELLLEKAELTLRTMGCANIHFKYGDGHQGWKEFAPFDAILVSAAPPAVPNGLVEQLAVGGKMVIPIGIFSQSLYSFKRTETGLVSEELLPVKFVPLVRNEKFLE